MHTSLKKQHGKHNADLCELLYHSYSGQYDDWVVTTAFYSCIHIIDHITFPLTYNNVEYDCFENYYQAVIAKQGYKTKHQVRKEMVREKQHKTIFNKFAQLMDDCHNARYSNYAIEDYIARNSYNTMKSILTLAK
jgi:hypothetical protein